MYLVRKTIKNVYFFHVSSKKATTSWKCLTMPPEKSQCAYIVNHAWPTDASQAETEWKIKMFFKFGKTAAGFPKALGMDSEYF